MVRNFLKALGFLHVWMHNLIFNQVAERRILELEATRDLSKLWLHVDMDAFYAAVETLKDPSLKGKPMAVGSMSMISTANYEVCFPKSALTMIWGIKLYWLLCLHISSHTNFRYNLNRIVTSLPSTMCSGPCRQGGLVFVLQCLVSLHVNYALSWFLFRQILRNILIAVI